MKNGDEFDEFISKNARLQRKKIGIGISKPDKTISESLEKASEFCDVVVFGESLKTLQSIATDNPEEAMVSALSNHEIDGIVRGQADAIKMRREITRFFNIKITEIKDLALVKDHFNRFFIICPVSITQGWTNKAKASLIGDAATLLRWLDIPVKIGLTSGCRPNTLGIRKLVDKTYYEAESLVSFLKNEFDIRHYYIDIDKAIADNVTVLVPANGFMGNGILRSLAFLGGIKIYGGLISGIQPIVVESFMSAQGYFDYLEFTAALINLKS